MNIIFGINILGVKLVTGIARPIVVTGSCSSHALHCVVGGRYYDILLLLKQSTLLHLITDFIGASVALSVN